MLSGYFTLYHTARLLNERFTGAVVAEVYSQEKNTLSMVLYTPEPQTIVISCTARQNYLLVREGNSRSRTNSVGLFGSLTDDHIRSVSMDRYDRIVSLAFRSGATLCLEMFAARANVLLCDGAGTVTDAFLRKKELLGTTRALRPDAGDPAVEDFLPPLAEFHSVCHPSGTTVLQRLKSAVPKFGATLCREAMHRAGIEDNAGILNGEETERLHTESASLLKELLRPTERLEPSVYFDDSSPVVFSLLPLRYFSSLRRETYDSLFVAMQKFLSFGKSVQSYQQKKKEILHWLNNESARTHRTIAAVEKELAESSRGEQYERFGKLLMANLHSIVKGTDRVAVEDHQAGGTTVEIPLDASLSPVRNAERYFEKSKRAKSAREESEERLLTLRKREKGLAALQETMEGVSDSISLKNFLHLHSTALKQFGFMTEKEQEELPPFKLFTVDGGFTVYAGKSSENNDLLTVKWAKPNDLWFHARGSSGSHVVLKTGSGSGTPSKKAIEQAAAIAAYYSKMKNARNVPVAMTEKKYVRKPKGVPAGTVVIEREKVIFVTPGLPHTEE